MANTLMFEVGIKQAVEGLDKAKEELDQFITDYTKKMQIQVDVKNLEMFINALKSIGNGEQLKPLLDQVERLQNRLGAMTDKGQYFDMLRGEAMAAAKAVEIAEQQLSNMKKTGNVNLISNARTNLEQAQQEAARTAEVLASATERFAKEESRAAATTSDTKQKIDALAQSVGELHTKIGSGININLSGDFSKWANEVNAVTASVRELVEQLQKMNNASTTAANVTNEALLTQAKTVSDLKTKLLGLYSDAMKIPKTEASYKAIEESKKVEQQLAQEQAKFNDMLTRGASVAGSYAEAIQQLGQKYSLTAEQAQKLASIIANGNLERGNVQRGLGIGYEKAGDIVETIKALQKLHQEENKPAPQGTLFDPQQFKSLQEAIDAVIREVNRLKEAFAGVGEIKGLKQLTENMNALFHNVSTFKDVFATLSAAVNLTPTSEYVKKLQTDFEAAQAKVQELTEKLNALAAVQNNVAEAASKAYKSEKQIGDSQAAMFNRYNKLLADIQNIKREIVEIQRGAGGGGPFGYKLGEYFSSLNRIRNVAREITSSPSVADAITKGMSSELLAKLNSALATLKTNYKEVIADAKDFNKATDKGSSQAEARIRKLGMAFNELKNYMRQNGGSEEMKRLQQEIQAAIRKMRELMNAGKHSEAVNVYERLSGIIRQAASATKEYEKSQQQAISITNQLSESEQRLANAIKSSTDSMRGQSQVLSDLKMMAMQYISVWGAQNFLNKIIETGGQLEQQRLSMGAILQDAEKADEIFGQIKALAVKSPFGVVQLDQMSKQLAAYSFEAEELFDWTKRLADISAATGTEVSRLALALGHVRSEGALSGYTLRQFSMGNVPLLKMLSQNRGVSAKEIRDLVRKKEISDKEVMEVLKQLTSDGGMFFNAQEVMSQALNARFKNLRDAFDIMYGEIAESGVGDVLKNIAITLTEGAKQWKRFGADVLFVIGILGTAKAAMLMYNNALGMGTAATLKSALATKKKEVANLELTASYRQLTFEELRTMASAGKLNATNIATLLSTKKLTYAELERAVALGKVDKAAALVALDSLKMYTQYDKLRKIAPLTGWARQWAIIKYNIQMAGAAMKSFMTTIAPFLAFTAAFDLIMKNIQQGKRAKEAGEMAAKGMLSGYKGLNELRDSLKSNRPSNDDERRAAIENMKNALTEAGRYDGALKQQVDTVDDLSRKYEILNQRLVQVSDEYGHLKAVMAAATEEGLRQGGGNLFNLWGAFRDTALENMKDLSKSSINLEVARNNMNMNRGSARKLMEEVLKYYKAWDESYKGLDWQELYDKMDDTMRSRVFNINARSLAQWLDITKDEAENLKDALDDWKDAWNEYQGDWNQVTDSQLAGFGDKMLAAYNVMYRNQHGEDFNLNQKEGEELGDYLGRISGFTSAFYEAFQKIGEENNISPQVIEDLWKKYAHSKGILALKEDLSKPASDALEEWQRDIQNFFNEHHIDIEVKAESTWDSLRDDLKKKKEQLQKDVDASGEILIGFGLKLENLPDNIDEFIQQSGITSSFQKDLAKFAFSMFKKSSEGLKGIGEVEKEVPGLVPSDDKNKNRSDERLKKAQTQLEEANSFLAEYKKYREVYGRERSINLLEELFPTTKGKGQKIVDEYKSILTDIKHSLELNTDDRKKFGISIDKLIAETDLTMAKERLDRQVKQMEQYLSDEASKFDLYNALLNKTGNKTFAMSAFANGQVWDDMTRSMAEVLREKMGGFSGIIDWDAEKQAMEDSFKKNYTNGTEIYKLWEKISDTIKDNYKKELEAVADSTEQLLTLDEKILKVEQEIEELKKNGASDNDARVIGKEKELHKLQTDLFEQSEGYLKFYAGIFSMTVDEAEAMGNAIRDNLVKQLAEGDKNADKYMKSMKNVQQQLEKMRSKRGLFMTLATGGIQGVLQQRQQTYEDQASAQAIRIQKAEEEITKSRRELEEATKNGTQEDIFAAKMKLEMAKIDRQIASGELTAAQKRLGITVEQLKQMNDVLPVMTMISGAIDGLQQGAQQISDMMKALGNESGANRWSDIAGYIGIVGSPVKSATNALKSAMSGDIGGIIGNAVGVITSPITQAAQLHDKHNQRVIDALKEDVSALEANTDAIKSARDRTLGYDNGELRRRMATEYARYNDRSWLGWRYNSKYGAAGLAMSEYYGTNTFGDSYAQELNNLEKLRKDYIDMYNEEADKKDSSNEALQEYTEKIAELDAQIMFFTEDLAKELWGIDVKSWADQLSDALTTAWENGEDAAEAFDDTVADIMRDVVNNMMKIGYVEPLMESLRESLFGENGAVQWKYDNNGQRTGIDWESSRDNFAKAVNDALGEGGWLRKELTENYPDMMDDIQRLMPDIDMKSEDESSSTGSSIKGITEQTADLLASYLNAVRADVAVNRAMIADYFPMYLTAMTSANQSLTNIENHTDAIMRSNDAIALSVAELQVDIRGLRNKTWKVPVA